MIWRSVFAGTFLSTLSVPFLCQADPVRVPPKLDSKIHCAYPEYPVSAFRNREQGVVDFELLVDQTGAVHDSRIINSSGSDALDKAAVSAMSRCHWVPAQLDGQIDPDPAWTRMTWTWTMGKH